MKHTRWLHFILLALSVGAVSAAPQRAAFAREPQCSGSIGNARTLTIDCSPGFATDHDRLTIHSRTDLDPAQPWSDQINDADATWLFDTSADGSVNLLIDFTSEGAARVARLYDSQNGMGTVSYGFENGALTVAENSGHPTIVVWAQDNWRLPNDLPNFNYDIEVDGPVEGMIDASQIYLDQLNTDGRIDLTVHVRDTDRDGRPDYEWRQAYPPLADEDGFYHSSVMVNTADDEPPIADPFFWPLLGSGATGFIKGDYGDTSPAPLNVDWAKSRVNLIVESVASRNRPHNYFVYSIERIKEGQINDVNFESPFAFYQFSPVQSNFPDLALRIAYYPQGNVSAHLPVEQVDFSWRQSSRNLAPQPDWDYRLGLLGHNAHAGVVELPDFSMRITPYVELPGWVANNTWDYATFVARESGEYLSSEGMYEWATLEGAVADVSDQEPDQIVSRESRNAAERFVKGTGEEIPAQAYQKIRAGLRGEFRSRSGQATLTFSPIDHKLHLLGADHGVWQIDAQSALRYANLDGDGYFDQWTYTEVVTGTQPMTITQQLNVAPLHLLYSDDQQVVLRKATVQSSLFETLPPVDREAWQALGAKLNANQQPFDPADLRAAMRQFNGSEMRINGARIRDYRPVGPDGFRFVLTLDPDAQMSGSNLLPLDGLQPGEYAVSYDGAFHIEPLTPPDLSATLPTTSLTALQARTLPITIHNAGQQDVPPSRLELWATPPQGQTTLVTSDTVTLLAQTTITPTLTWTPPADGTWTLAVKLVQPDQSIVALDPQQIVVAPAQTPSATTMIAVSSFGATQPLLVLLVLVIAVVAAIVFARVWLADVEGTVDAR